MERFRARAPTGHPAPGAKRRADHRHQQRTQLRARHGGAGAGSAGSRKRHALSHGEGHPGSRTKGRGCRPRSDDRQERWPPAPEWRTAQLTRARGYSFPGV
ncbi:hypothetical protein ZWY2020_052592 [Hordeum vulgare]|nr:hypothetical protein ZWY2020_052592 [Hordeum vulgare]